MIYILVVLAIIAFIALGKIMFLLLAAMAIIGVTVFLGAVIVCGTVIFNQGANE